MGFNFPGQESSVTNMPFSKTLVYDDKSLCSFNIWGVGDDHFNRDEVIYDYFFFDAARNKEQ